MQRRVSNLGGLVIILCCPGHSLSCVLFSCKRLACPLMTLICPLVLVFLCCLSYSPKKKEQEEGSFPCVVGKEFPAFPSHLKRSRSPQERREELQGRPTIPRDNQMSQSIPGKPVFPALPRLSTRVSTETTVARGTALCESLVGKHLIP